MTRKHYVALAEALRNARPEIGPLSAVYNAQHTAWLACVCSIAHALQTDNPRFDSPRFQDACGVNSIDSPSRIAEDVFGPHMFDQLTLAETVALGRDVNEICDSENLSMRDAMLTLRNRIGGPRNLKSYCECLTAGKDC